MASTYGHVTSGSAWYTQLAAYLDYCITKITNLDVYINLIVSIAGASRTEIPSGEVHPLHLILQDCTQFLFVSNKMFLYCYHNIKYSAQIDEHFLYYPSCVHGGGLL